MSKAFWLFGTRSTGKVVSQDGDRASDLYDWGQHLNLRMYSVFRNAPGWNSTTQREFLVIHHADPHWLALGIPSDVVMTTK